jgi:Yip1 domain
MNFARIIRLFIKPQEYWNEVVAEPGDIKSLLMPQMLILAAIPAASVFLGTLMGIMRFSFVRALIAAVVAAILTYIFQIAIWILFGVMINVFAGVFRGNKDFEQSMKLATGAAISVYAGSVFSIIPVFGMSYLGFLAGYGYAVFLLIKGFPIMNGVSGGKAVGYAFAVVGIMFAIAMFMYMFSGCTMACVAYGGRY